MKLKIVRIVLFVFVYQTTMGLIAHAQDPVDLTSWTVESYLPFGGWPNADWAVSADQAEQLWNSQPTLLYSDFSALWTALEVDVYSIAGDDDYFGFAVGFEPGDTSNPSADYLLIDWKAREQRGYFPSSVCDPYSWADTGLAASRVFGVPTAAEFWGHSNRDDQCSDLYSGLEELTRGINLGNAIWDLCRPDDCYVYHFRLEYTPTFLRVYVDGSLEIDISGTFSDERWAFYGFSQPATYFVNPTLESLVLSVDIDIKPGSDLNPINPDSQGVVPVAILTTEDFDASTVDPDSIEIAGRGVAVRGKGNKSMAHLEDVDGDGDIDLLVQVNTFVEDHPWDTGPVDLTGETFDGVPIAGRDNVLVVPN